MRGALVCDLVVHFVDWFISLSRIYPNSTLSSAAYYTPPKILFCVNQMNSQALQHMQS